MKIELTKEWCLRMARLEDATEISAGLHALDPSFQTSTNPAHEKGEEPSIAFGRFVRLMRRHRGLSLEKLADDADLDLTELIGIEENALHKPEIRAVYQLAQFFRLSQESLLQIAGLTIPRDTQLAYEAVRFAARSEPVAALTSEEKAALDAFVAVLSEK